MDYEKLLKKAIEKISKKTSTIDRFKLPEIVCEIQGNKTVIKNFGEIVMAMRRDTNHLARYLFNELATPGNIQGNMLILQTKVSKSMLEKKINDYVKEFVYCKVCGEPDTKIVKEGRLAFVVCEACGAKKPVK